MSQLLTLPRPAFFVRRHLLGVGLAVIATLCVCERSVYAQQADHGSFGTSPPLSVKTIEPAFTLRWQPEEPAVIPLPKGEGTNEQIDEGVAQQGGLSLAELEAMALGNHPGLRRAVARLQAARGRWVQAGLPPNPRVGYTAGEIGNEGQAGQQGGMVAQQLITGGKLRLNRAVARGDIMRSQRELAAQQGRVINDVRSAFYDVLAAHRRLLIAQRLVAISQEAVATAEALVQAQEASQADLLQAKIEADTTTIVLNNARNRYDAAWRTLAAAVGVPDLPPQPLAGKLEDDGRVFEFEEALARVIRESPEVAAAWANVNRARWALARARVEPIPNLNLQGSVQYDDASGFTIAGAQLSMPIPIWNRNQGGIREAAGNLAAARADALRLELSLQQRLAAAFERYANARQQVERYRGSIIPNAKRTLDMVLLAYRQGEFPYIRLLTAQRTFFQANLAYVDALRELRVSTVVIDGLLLEGGLAP